MTIGVKFAGPVYDGSGYAEFGRGFLSALHYYPNDLDVTLQAISFEKNKPDVGEHAKVLSRIDGKQIPYQLKVVNAIPDAMPQLHEPGVKNVCFTMFETTRIPQIWVDCLNKYTDAVFVPCHWNREVFQNSGVTKPIHVVHPGLNAMDFKTPRNPVNFIELRGVEQHHVTFYSIFQWTERKCPDGLIKSYLSAFDGVEDVVLVLKTYGSDNSLPQQERVKTAIQNIKASLRLKAAPKILLIGQLLSNHQIRGLHEQCDCFVLPHRAEGFGMPHIEAMACGKPVISTGFSGNVDFMNKDNSYLIDSQMTIVSNMPWIPYYEADMQWAEPNLIQLQEYMKVAYRDIKAARDGKYTPTMALAAHGQQDILSKFNWETSAQSFADACKKVLND